MDKNLSVNNRKISKGFTISLLIFLLSILNTFFYLQYSQGNISSFFIIFFGIIFSMSIFGAVYSFADFNNEIDAKNKQLNLVITELEKRFIHLNDITQSLNTDEINKLFEKILVIGCQSLNMEIGLIAKIEGNNYTILSSVGEDYIGGKNKTLEFAKTCCGITYYANEIVLLDNLGKSLFQNHPCRSFFKIESYVGMTLFIDKNKVGTINLFSKHPRNIPFTDSDRKYIQLMAKIISMTIEHKYWQEKQKSNNEELEWLDKIKIGRELRMIELKREIVDLKKIINNK